jgi:TRAP-type mannitol/chloroaromatic compound transport system permease large subunit
VPGDGRRLEQGRVKAYRTVVTVFALTFVGLGFALLVITALRGGGVGLVIGALFIALGAGRLYLLRMRK